MLDAFKDLLCSELSWHNRPWPGPINMYVRSMTYRSQRSYDVHIFTNYISCHWMLKGVVRYSLSREDMQCGFQ